MDGLSTFFNIPYKRRCAVAYSYLQFSFAFDCGSKEIAEKVVSASIWLADAVLNDVDLDAEHPGMPVALAKTLIEEGSSSFGFQADRHDDTHVWIHDDAGDGNSEDAARFTQWILQTFFADEDFKASFQWAETCDKPRFDSFGGGACVIDKNNIKWLSTASWIQENL
jgi:hypothetical protein